MLHCFDYCNLITSWSQLLRALNCVLPKVILAVQGSVHFHRDCESSLSISAKVIGILLVLRWMQRSHWRGVRVLTIESVLTRGISAHLFRQFSELFLSSSVYRSLVRLISDFWCNCKYIVSFHFLLSVPSAQKYIWVFVRTVSHDVTGDILETCRPCGSLSPSSSWNALTLVTDSARCRLHHTGAELWLSWPPLTLNLLKSLSLQFMCLYIESVFLAVFVMHY